MWLVIYFIVEIEG